MPINPFREQGAFVPEATAAMGEAFDTACKELCDVGQLQMVRKVVAQRIIAAAHKGDLDPARLRAAALSGLPLHKMAPQLSALGGRFDHAIAAHPADAQRLANCAGP